MNLLRKSLKLSILVLLIFVLAIVFMPTPKGAFVIIHFTTTLQAWFTVQILFTALAIAAQTPRRIMCAVGQQPLLSSQPVLAAIIPAVGPLRC
jgi:hypothetical protein